jgi:hypothetical protein
MLPAGSIFLAGRWHRIANLQSSGLRGVFLTIIELYHVLLYRSRLHLCRYARHEGQGAQTEDVAWARNLDSIAFNKSPLAFRFSNRFLAYFSEFLNN